MNYTCATSLEYDSITHQKVVVIEKRHIFPFVYVKYLGY